MGFKVFLAVLTARLVRFALRLMHRGATALPGKTAMKICPDLLRYLAKDVKTVVVTGTNGKTTSCRIVEQVMREAKVSYFANRGGANLTQGITTEFAMRCTLTGKPKFDYAVIECDEGVTGRVCGYIDPAVLLVTNVFSDQMDRFGDVLNTLEYIKTGAKNSPHAVLCLNADDSMSASVARELPNEVVYYGVETPIYRERVQEASDAPHCLFCGAEYEYSYTTYGHLGGFACPHCGYKRPDARVAVMRVLSQTADRTDVELRADGELFPVSINVPGGYNIYNAAGAVAVSLALGFGTEAGKLAAENFEVGFGRMERIDMDGHPARMVLVKNPAGCNQALNFLTNLDGETLFVICLNDNIGDGTDISWVWDVDFEKLCAMGDRLSGVICSGTRGADMALRLKYAGLPMEKLTVINDYSALIDAMCAQSVPIVMMPTYSAMMDLRDKLAARFGLKEFWE